MHPTPAPFKVNWKVKLETLFEHVVGYYSTSFVVVPVLRLLKATFGCYYIKIMDYQLCGCFMKHNMGSEFCIGLLKECLTLPRPPSIVQGVYNLHQYSPAV